METSNAKPEVVGEPVKGITHALVRHCIYHNRHVGLTREEITNRIAYLQNQVPLVLESILHDITYAGLIYENPKTNRFYPTPNAIVIESQVPKSFEGLNQQANILA